MSFDLDDDYSDDGLMALHEEISQNGYADVMCECGEDYRIEPDAEFNCHECGALVQSPLVKEGLI